MRSGAWLVVAGVFAVVLAGVISVCAALVKAWVKMAGSDL